MPGIDAFMSWVLTPLCLLGALLAVYLMQLTSYEAEDGFDPPSIRWFRRTSLAVVAIALISAVLFADARAWQPWPSHVALILGIVMMMGTRTLAIRARIRREGSRRAAAPQSDERLFATPHRR